MQDFLNTVALLCASAAALALGVILAYACCQAGFAAMRSQARLAEPKAPEPEAEVVSIP